MMVDDIQSETNVEWLWTLDLAELSWEILRYRCLKKRILDAHRVKNMKRHDLKSMSVDQLWSLHELVVSVLVRKNQPKKRNWISGCASST